MIRALQFKYALKIDGVTAIMLNLYEHMDPSQVSFDFLVGDEKVPDHIRRRIEERGGRIYSIAAACRERNRLAYTLHKVAFCYRLMREKRYDLVHVHTENAGRSLILIFAGLAGIRGRILHSHSAFTQSGKKGAVKQRIFKQLLPLWTNGYLTCSAEAARWMFPARLLKNGWAAAGTGGWGAGTGGGRARTGSGRAGGGGRGSFGLFGSAGFLGATRVRGGLGSGAGQVGGRVVMIPNGISVEDFRFSPEVRQQVRKEFGAEDSRDFLLCTVGRLAPEKNYGFLLLVLKALIQRMKTPSGQEEARFRLLFVGEGPEETALRELAEELEISSRVDFLGNREDVPRLLMGADCFLLSSFFEGLPLVLVEAQASGLPCVASDRITRQVELTGQMTYLPVESPEKRESAQKLAERWARQIQAVSRDPEREIWRPEGAILVKEAGFDVSDAARKLERYYRAMAGRGRKKKKEKTRR